LPKRSDPISRDLRTLYDKVRVAYLSARERPKDYKDEWASVVEDVRLKWDSPSNVGDLLRDKLSETLLFDKNALDPQGAKAKRIYENVKEIQQDSSFSKDPFRKKYGDKLLETLVKDKIVYAMFLHWAYRVGRGALESWKQHTDEEDNFTEGYVGLDLTDKEIYEWLDENYGEDFDIKRLKSKLNAARQLLYKVFTTEHTPQEWNELVESKKILKGRKASQKKYRDLLRELVDKYVDAEKEVISIREITAEFEKLYELPWHISIKKIYEWAGKRLTYTYSDKYIRRKTNYGAEYILKSDISKEDKGTKNNFILPNKPMYRIFEIDDMKELKGFTGEWVVQEKYDGMRIQIHKTDTIKIYSYNNRDITGKFDKQIKILKNDKFPDCILDAEAVLYNGDEPLHRADTISYINADNQSKDYKLKVHVFDIMRLEKEDIGPQKLEERLNKLMGTFSTHSDEYLQFPTKRDTRFADSLEEIEDYAKAIMKNPTSEGVIIKDAKSSYIIGKKKNPKWIKWKKFVDLDLIILDVRTNKNNTYSYTLGAGPIMTDTEYKPLVELDGAKYLSVGKALNTKIKSSKGKIIRVKVDEVKKTSSGFSIYSAKVIEKPEVEEPEKIITLEFLSKDNKKSASDYSIEVLTKSYTITDGIHGNATLNTSIDTDGFILSGFYENNLMAKNAILDIDIWKEELKQQYIKDNGVFMTAAQQEVMENDIREEDMVKIMKEKHPNIVRRIFSSDSKDIEKNAIIGYIKDKGKAYGIIYNNKMFSYDDKTTLKSIIKIENYKYELWKREDGDLNFMYKIKDRNFTWRIEQDSPSDLYKLFGKADKFLAQLDKKPDTHKLVDKGELELGAQRDGYHEYLLDGKMYNGKFHFRVVPIDDENKWVAWTGYETKPTDESSDEDMWNIEADKHKSITYSN